MLRKSLARLTYVVYTYKKLSYNFMWLINIILDIASGQNSKVWMAQIPVTCILWKKYNS
jgi:presenilin-like A22 family membrane protease